MFLFFFSICYKRVKQNAGEELELKEKTDYIYGH